MTQSPHFMNNERPQTRKKYRLQYFTKILSLSISLLSMTCVAHQTSLYASQEIIDNLPDHNDPWHPGKTFSQVIQSTIFELVNGKPYSTDFEQEAILDGKNIKQDHILQAAKTYKDYLLNGEKYDVVQDNPVQTNENRNFAVNTAMDTLRNTVTENPDNLYITYLYLNRLKTTPIVDFQGTGAGFSTQDQLILNSIKQNLLFQSFVTDCDVEVQNQAYHIAQEMAASPFLFNSLRDANPDATDEEIQQEADRYTESIKANAMKILIPLWKNGHEKARDYVASHLLHPVNLATEEIKNVEAQINIHQRNINAAQEMIQISQQRNNVEGINRCQETIAYLMKANDTLRQQQTIMIEQTQTIVKSYVEWMELNRSMQSFVLHYLSGRGIPQDEPVWLGLKILTAVGDYYGLKLNDFLENNQVNYDRFYDTVLQKLQEKFDPDLVTATLTWRALNSGTLPTLNGLMESYEKASPYSFYETLATAIWRPSYHDLFFNGQDIGEGTQKHRDALEKQMGEYYKKLIENDTLTGRSDGQEFVNHNDAEYTIKSIHAYDALEGLQKSELNLSYNPQGQATPTRLIQTIVDGKVVTMVASTNQHYPDNEQAGIAYTTEDYLKNIDQIISFATDGTPTAQSFLIEYIEKAFERPKTSVFHTVDLWGGLVPGQRLKLSLEMLNALRFIEKNLS